MEIYDVASLYLLVMMVSAVVFSLAFWIWMLIDCAKRKQKNKIIWLLVIFLLNLIGAVTY